jgi:enoyl-CoA hydratase
MTEPPEQTLEQLRVDRPADGIVVVTLDQADRRNAMSQPMTRSWARVMADLRADRLVRCVVVTGAGTAFCAGGELGWLASDPSDSVTRCGIG